MTGRVPGVVLAAGRSSRMGRSKALLRLPSGEQFCARVVSTLLQADIAPVHVVIRPHDDAVTEALAGQPADLVRLIVNPDPDRGQLSSLQQGLAALEPSAPAAAVTLVDVPLVSADSVARLISSWQASRAPLVRPARNGRHGHPIIIGRAAIDALGDAAPSTSARDVLQRFVPLARDIEVDDVFAFEDVDTPADYARLLAQLRAE